MAQRAAGRPRRRWLLYVAIAVGAAVILLSTLSSFYVDLLWFREVHLSSVFWSVFWSKVLLGSIFGVLFFILLGINLMIVRRMAPQFRPFSPEQELIERYRAAFQPYARWLIPGLVAFISLFVGIAAASQWQTFLLWRSVDGVRFGAQYADPVFHRDPSFYIFTLPFYKFVQGWLFSALVGITVIVAVAHYLTGGIRAQSPGQKVSPQVKAHLSVLLGLIVLVKAWGYYLGRFDLLVSTRGVVTGASYTDIHAELPALTLLVFIAIGCAILFLVNIRFRGWALPVLGIGLLALTSIVAGALVPAAVQRFSVDPQELQKERQYIERNIEATRFAFALNTIRTNTSQVATDVTAEQADANQATLSNIRLWSPDILRTVYDTAQRIQPYYEFSDVDVDRYEVNGAVRVVMMSPREVSQNGIPAGGATWQNKHLFYTHGFGAVASLASSVTSQGLPSTILQNIPPEDGPGIEPGQGIPLSPGEGSQVYYGERNDVSYVVADTKSGELNYPNPNGQGQVKTVYRGSGGIPMGSFFRQLVFAYRYRDFNLLISGLINGDSKILINREIRARIRKAAPFLAYDKDPYAAIVGGRLVYIQDAYTLTNLYPYSQQVNLADSTGNDLTGQANYIRNSVKVVVDAYNGTLTFYVVDPSDPLIQVWERAFPHLFTTSAAPAEIQAHFRYPEDLMLVQATEYANYHVTDPSTFYGKENFWALPPDPTQANNPTLRPYYVLLRLPDAVDERFVLFMPFTPFNRANMVAYLAGQSDPGDYGRLQSYELTSGGNVAGPQQVFSLINQDPAFSEQRTLLGQQGSQVVFGNLLIVPIEQSFLYVQPIFVVSNQTNAIPELKFVVVVHGGVVTLGTSLPDALAKSFGQVAPPPSGGGGGGGGGGETVADLLAQAQKHFDAANAALKNGDLATYQSEINQAAALIQQALQLAQSGTSGPGPTPTPSTSPTPIPTPTPTG